MKISWPIKTALALLFIWSALALVQLWVAPLSADVFIKVTASIAIVLLLLAASTLMLTEYRKEKRLEKNDFLDG